MTVAEFVKGCNASDNFRNYLTENIKISRYAPYNTKIAYAENIVRNTCLDETGNYKEDTPQLDLMIRWSMLRIYTDIQLDPQNVIAEYDMLCESGLLDDLLGVIGAETFGDSDDFRHIVSAKKEDLKANSYEIHNFLARCVMNLSPMVTPILEQVATLLSDVDTDAITNTIMEKIGADNDNKDVSEAV